MPITNNNNKVYLRFNGALEDVSLRAEIFVDDVQCSGDNLLVFVVRQILHNVYSDNQRNKTTHVARTCRGSAQDRCPRLSMSSWPSTVVLVRR